MATLTISYDGRNKIARNVVELIRSLDEFQILQPKTEMEKEWTAEEERQAFLCTSRKHAARILADEI